MKTLRLFILAAIFLLLNLNAQNVTIRLKNSPNNAALLELEGEKANEIDTLIAEINTFFFSMKNYHSGIYRLSFDRFHSLNFVYDGSDVEIETDYKNVFDSLKVVNSESNKLYYEFVKLNKSFKTKTELLNVILQHYPKDDNFYNETLKKFEEIQYEYSFFTNVTSQKKPESFIARYIRSSQLPVVDGKLPFDEQIKYLKAHALDYVNFNDDELIYSDCFTNKTIEYLTYYKNPQLPKPLLEKEFMSAVDTLLNKAKINEVVYRQITEYLIDGFRKFGFDKIIDYIIDNYVITDDLCLDETLEHSIQNRIDQARKLRIGSVVPNIVLPDTSGKIIDLSKLNSDKTLIIFYASWCPHCKEIVPQIANLYKSQKKKNIEVLAVALDKKRQDWIKFIKDNNLNWLNVSDLQGWNGKVAKDYLIYATPTMFLIDKNKKIIAKPFGIPDLKKWF